jgi:hypothetical protein
MAKDKQDRVFRLKDATSAATHGEGAAIGAIEKAISNGVTVLHEVWKWLLNYIENPRALALLKEHARALVPEKYLKEAATN